MKQREIKFRAWHIAEEKMCNVNVINFSLNGAFLKGVIQSTDQIISDGKFIISAPEDGRFCDNAEFHLMQFTGLLDKNGKEVYEGDIVNAAFMHHGKPGLKFMAYIIYNENIGSFRIAYDSLGGGSQDEIYFTYEIEIIGNIHQTPSLLTNKI